ncbi:unnamed protein product, partial [Symbiodinium pilosum]
LNLSNSHAHHEIDADGVAALAFAKVPGFRMLPRIPDLESPFISLGSAHRMFLRPPSHPSATALRNALQRLGVSRPLQALRWQEEDALISCCIRRRKEFFIEPGRVFTSLPRLAGARLPGDVPRTANGELRALRHVGRLLLSRCPSSSLAREECEGWLRLQVRYSSHMAILSTLLCLASLFPRVRLEVEFEEESPQRQQEQLADVQGLNFVDRLAERNMSIMNTGAYVIRIPGYVFEEKLAIANQHPRENWVQKLV